MGNRIRKIRGELTQIAFAKMLGIKANALCRYEQGRIPDQKILDQIAEFGNTTVEWLLQGDEKRAPPKLLDHVPEKYETRPAELKIDALARSLFLARQFLRSERRRLSMEQEAELATYIYEHIESEHAEPGPVVIRRLADLIQR